MKTRIVLEQELSCLREHLIKANEIINRLGFGINSEANMPKSVKKEPTKKERIANYSELLSSDSKYKKPKHLQK